jgi:hypothetical protein
MTPNQDFHRLLVVLSAEKPKIRNTGGRDGELAVEFICLAKLHADAIHAAVYLPMTALQKREYDVQRDRMNEIVMLLGGAHDSSA